MLIVISRYIEKLSYDADAGTHRASFQRLSRIRDESGTKRVYERLGESGVDCHVYGQPDWIPPEHMQVTMHGAYWADFKQTWFVLHNGPTDQMALVAVETDTNVWDATWTSRPERVDAIEETIRDHL